MNSFLVPVQIIRKREDALLLQHIQMGAEMDAAGEMRGEVRRWKWEMGRWEDEKRKEGSKGRERQPGVNTVCVMKEQRGWRDGGEWKVEIKK